MTELIIGAARLTLPQLRAVLEGPVTVALTPQAWSDVERGAETVAAEGKPLTCQQFVYIMLNKPKGVVSASTDRRDRTVVDLLEGAYPRRELFPAGRLDKTSTGFVLLTDDGAFAHAILSPRRHVPKTYRVELDTPVTPAMVTAFAQGVTLADGQAMKPADLIPDPENPLAATVVLHQGVYHQIKRMFGVLDAGVNELHRQAIGGLALDPALAPGQWRPITEEELARLAPGLAPGGQNA